MPPSRWQRLCLWTQPKASPIALQPSRCAGDVEARIDKVGTSFSQLADVMPFYSKVSSVNKSIMDDDKATTCERFCKVVEEHLQDAVAMFDSEAANLSKLAEKFEWLGRL